MPDDPNQPPADQTPPPEPKPEERPVEENPELQQSVPTEEPKPTEEIPTILEFGQDYTTFITFYKRYQQSIFGDPNERSMLREDLEYLYPRINSTLGYEVTETQIG